MAIYHEGYTISRPRTGDAKIKRLVLTGWGNDPSETGGEKSLEGGRCYWVVTAANVLDIYNGEDTSNDTKIMSGSIDANTDEVVLAAQNVSGISGTCLVEHTAGTASSGEIIVTYAYEADIKLYVPSLASLLDGSSQWEGGARFEKAMLQAKELIDEALIAKLRPRFIAKASGVPDLSAIASPRQLAKVHAMKTAAILLFNHAGVDPSSLDRAESLDRMADRALKTLEIDIDTGNDDIVDESVPLSSSLIVRG